MNKIEEEASINIFCHSGQLLFQDKVRMAKKSFNYGFSLFMLISGQSKKWRNGKHYKLFQRLIEKVSLVVVQSRELKEGKSTVVAAATTQVSKKHFSGQ